MSEDITIIQGLYLMGGRWNSTARVYYYKGNIFRPMQVDGREVGRIKRFIKQFFKDNLDMVSRDREAPDYKTYDELIDVKDVA